MKSRFAVCFAIAALAISSPAFPALNAYMKFDGIQGEASDPAHKGWIEIESFSWSQLGTCASGDASFTTKTSSASPKLAQATVKGTLFPSATFDVNGQRHMLQNVMISSFQAGGGQMGGAVPIDSFSLHYARCATHARPASAVMKKVIAIKGESNASLFVGGSAAGEPLALRELKLDGPNHATLIGVGLPATPGRGLIILQNAARNQSPLPTLTIETRKGKWTFTDIKVTKQSDSQSPRRQGPEENFTLNFAKVDGPASGFQDMQ